MASRLEELSDLRTKYVALVALARSREALEAQGVRRLEGEAGSARRAETRELARRFPACLRELDGLSSADFEVRLRHVEVEIARLDAGASEVAAERRWILLMLELHAALRQVLALKLKAGKRKDPAQLDAVAAEVAPMDAARLVRYLRPPGGRALALVLSELAQRHGLSEEAVRRLLFEETREDPP